MRIVHLFKDFDPPVRAGITRYIRDVADDAAVRGHEVEVHVAGTRHNRRDELSSGVVVHRHREIARVLSSPIAPGLLRSFSGEVLHLHMPHPLGEVSVLRTKDVPVVTTFHAQLGRQAGLEPAYRRLRDAVLRRSAAVLVATDVLAAVPELRASDRVEVLPYGISPRVRRPLTFVARTGPLRVLTVGRLVYYKGVDVLLRAVAEVPDTELVVVGEGPLRPELEALATSLNIAHRAQFLGAVDDDRVSELLGCADIFVLPSVSRAESFGLAMAEAMAAGVPAISTSLGTGTDWVNIHGETGLVVPPGDHVALADAIRRLAADEVLRSRLADGASRRVNAELSFAGHMDRLLNVYDAVVR